MSEIHHDTVVLKNGGLRGVLNVEAINFNLKSETEQQGIIAGYQSFVNTLNFPLQIVIRSSKMNIDPYLMQLRSLGEAQQNDLLKTQSLDQHDQAGAHVDMVGLAYLLQQPMPECLGQLDLELIDAHHGNIWVLLAVGPHGRQYGRDGSQALLGQN